MFGLTGAIFYPYLCLVIDSSKSVKTERTMDCDQFSCSQLLLLSIVCG